MMNLREGLTCSFLCINLRCSQARKRQESIWIKYLELPPLLKKENIPQISLQLPLIKEIQSERFWNEVDAKKLDDVRLALRELIKYLDRERQLPIYTNFEDDLDVDGVEVESLLAVMNRSLPTKKGLKPLSEKIKII